MHGRPANAGLDINLERTAAHCPFCIIARRLARLTMNGEAPRNGIGFSRHDTQHMVDFNLVQEGAVTWTIRTPGSIVLSQLRAACPRTRVGVAPVQYACRNQPRSLWPDHRDQ